MAKKSKLYTKTGDKGKTSLVGGQRVPKSCNRLESYGTVDELNSFIGLLMAYLPADDINQTTLKFVQHKLFTVGAYLATDNSEPMDFEIPSGITKDTIKRIEGEIDRLDAAVPPLELFILPSGGKATSAAHICRVVARRAERCIYRVVDEGAEVEEGVLKFVNRLSDYFFILARNLARMENGEEITWDQTCQ
ncbi:cob(I)yrinic acid a,c-diamide adenosyltransferase [Porphyromonas sp.]|uniref:cob(I)yrinic acid a,c-diamide adenosyltransferase n=1 Tax=Porphyromonas sp. TaxID=1924944 RepID=UPI0026DAB89F|nr:cob(I)yrinic acid a,c-diamide adenosyltransferase [Porphyromonas sp.]MDO4695531.1 cob(I)yrinic acid a,c-diamide adenosyltransferase [Porphyromonas sp.]MDO4771867.1 cob(I)yrinic acid a,c-diamide adenosyltransferase [Porphyromonas sp.]